jgi:hypothetical protein
MNRVGVLRTLDIFIEKVVSTVTINVTTEITEANPVLTGFSASNWIPSIGVAVESPFGSKVAVSSAAQQSGLLQVATIYKLPRKTYIANNVDYIGDLNNGSSVKAPSGFVQTSIAKGIRNSLGIRQRT